MWVTWRHFSSYWTWMNVCIFLNLFSHWKVTWGKERERDFHVGKLFSFNYAGWLITLIPKWSFELIIPCCTFSINLQKFLYHLKKKDDKREKKWRGSDAILAHAKSHDKHRKLTLELDCTQREQRQIRNLHPLKFLD